VSEKYYRVRTAAKLIDSEFSSRTLYSWIAKIEKRTTYLFLRKDILRNGIPVSQILLTEEDILLLKKLHRLRNGERKELTAAIFATFLSPEDLAERLMIEENIL
jgi:hypothetical protein